MIVVADTAVLSAGSGVGPNKKDGIPKVGGAGPVIGDWNTGGIGEGDAWLGFRTSPPAGEGEGDAWLGYRTSPPAGEGADSGDVWVGEEDVWVGLRAPSEGATATIGEEGVFACDGDGDRDGDGEDVGELDWLAVNGDL